MLAPSSQTRIEAYLAGRISVATSIAKPTNSAWVFWTRRANGPKRMVR
jgi:hypothetical protein